MTAGLKNKYGPWVSGEDFFNRDTEVRRLTELIDDGNYLTETAVAGALEPKNALLLAQSLTLKNPDAVLREVLDILQHDGYLEWDEHAKTWLFVSRLVKDWWKKRFSQSYVPPQEQR